MNLASFGCLFAVELDFNVANCRVQRHRHQTSLIRWLIRKIQQSSAEKANRTGGNFENSLAFQIHRPLPKVVVAMQSFPLSFPALFNSSHWHPTIFQDVPFFVFLFLCIRPKRYFFKSSRKRLISLEPPDRRFQNFSSSSRLLVFFHSFSIRCIDCDFNR